MIIDEGIIRRGRPYNIAIRDRILAILQDLPIATPQRIKEKYEMDYQVPISWTTVNNRLTELLREQRIFRKMVTPQKNVKGTIRIRIHKIYSLKPLDADYSV
jgi:hypothetical protein